MGTGATYTPDESDDGKTLTLAITYTNNDGVVETVSATSLIGTTDDDNTTLTLSSPIEEGTTVSVASLASDPDGNDAITGYV